MFMKYSVDQIKEVLKEQFGKDKIDESIIDAISKLTDDRDYCFDSYYSLFKMGDLVYISTYGEVGIVIGKVDAFGENKEWENQVKKAGSERNLIMAGGKKPSPRYLVLTAVPSSTTQYDALVDFYNYGQSPKHPTDIASGDRNLRIRYPKEDTLKPLLMDQGGLPAECSSKMKSDINNFCTCQCIFSDGCSPDCVLNKYKK